MIQVLLKRISPKGEKRDIELPESLAPGKLQFAKKETTQFSRNFLLKRHVDGKFNDNIIMLT